MTSHMSPPASVKTDSIMEMLDKGPSSTEWSEWYKDLDTAADMESVYPIFCLQTKKTIRVILNAPWSTMGGKIVHTGPTPPSLTTETYVFVFRNYNCS